MYEIKYSNAVKRYFKKIKEKGLKQSFTKALKEIQKDPYIGSPKKGDLSGIYGDNFVKYGNWVGLVAFALLVGSILLVCNKKKKEK